MHSADAVRAAARAEVAAAERMNNHLEDRERANEPFTNEFLESRWTWAIRLREARIAAAENPPARISAARAHLEWCRRWSSVLWSRREEESTRLRTWGDYIVSEGERRVAELGGG